MITTSTTPPQINIMIIISPKLIKFLDENDALEQFSENLLADKVEFAGWGKDLSVNNIEMFNFNISNEGFRFWNDLAFAYLIGQ